MNTQHTVSLSILGKEYKILCTEDEQTDLIRSAQQLDLKMRNIRHNGKVSTNERVAVLAALNLTHELIQFKDKTTPVASNLDQRLKKMSHKIETVLKNV